MHVTVHLPPNLIPSHSFVHEPEDLLLVVGRYASARAARDFGRLWKAATKPAENSSQFAIWSLLGIKV